MAELAIFITVRAKSGQRDALRSLWEAQLKPRAAANAAQSTYVYAYDMQDEDVIHITEIYETMAAFEANAQAPWFAEYMQVAEGLIEGEPTFRMGAPQWIKQPPEGP